MPNLKRIITLLALLLVSLATEAQDVVIIKNEADLLLAGKQTYFFEDTSARLTIGEIVKPNYQSQFRRFDKDIFTNKATPHPLWLKLTVQNQSQAKAWIALSTTFLWYIDCYTLQNNDYQLTTQTGTLRPASTKAFPVQFYWFPLQDNASPQTFYFRIKTYRPIEVPIEVGTMSSLYENQQKNGYIVAGFVGLMLVMFFYNLFIFITTKVRIYLWYIAYLLTALFQTTYLNNYPLFFNEKVLMWANLYVFVWSSIPLLLIIFFTIHFLDVHKIAPKFIYPIHFFTILLGVILPIINIFNWVHYTKISLAMPLIILSLSALLFVLALYLWIIKKQRKAKFYFLAWAGLLIAIIVYFLVIRGFLPYNFITRNAVFFGISMEVVVFAIALADRINVMREEKAQAQTENLKLVKEQNIRLEEKVQERTVEIQQTNEELNITLSTVAKQRDDIVSSINYALRIQKAIIPTESEVHKYFPESFVFFKPRDIVSGDFYWFADKGDRKIIAVADCTGHGVSGALMTMIANNILNQIVNSQEIYEPDEILNRMSPLLEKTLLHAEGKVKDGMDISIITLENLSNVGDLKNVRVAYAGAMNPLYYIQNQELKEIKADKMPIGGHYDEDFKYHKHTLQLQDVQDFTIYMLTDGFQDQFGGAENKKFMVGNFKKLLLEISTKQMAEQKQVLSQTFNDWKGVGKQTDDVLVFGLRI